ncbi:MAG: hypothetical protein ACYS32_12035 [Planctomycetota bacterium]
MTGNKVFVDEGLIVRNSGPLNQIYIFNVVSGSHNHDWIRKDG